MFQTPREAILQAENDRLSAENAYLRRAVDGATLTPIGMQEDMEIRGPIPHELRLPIAMSVKGQLMRAGNYSVVARTAYGEAENLEVAYFCDGTAIKSKADYAVNELLPYLHEQFIRALVVALKR
jgi:hypothetical protein